MRAPRFVAFAIAAFAMLLLAGPLAHRAWAQAGAALTGTVTSPDGAPLEGVVVTAVNPRSTITISVVSGADGGYRFPASKLAPGNYFLAIRAEGFELPGNAAAQVAAGQTATADLKLAATRDLAHQLTNAEWLASFPGTDAQKKPLLACTGCHTLERLARSTHNADEWVDTMNRMFRYAQVSTPLKPQKLKSGSGFSPPPEQLRRTAEYLASIDLSATPEWQYPLKVFPRVTGRGTHVVITEYGLPRPTVEPHDVILDPQGKVWYSDFGEMFFGSLDPKSGKVNEYPVPLVRQGFAVGMLDLERAKTGDFWLGVMYQDALARFDPKTKKFTEWRLPKTVNDDTAQINMVTTRSDVSGKVWTNNVGAHDVYRLDLATGKMEHFLPYDNLAQDSPLYGKPHAIYGMAADSHDNLYMLDFASRWIGRLDAKTGEPTFYPTPTDNSWPRRGHIDDRDRLWFAEFGGNRVAMFDTNSKAFEEWEMPTPWTAPYDATIDKNDEIWTGGMTSDRIVRVDSKTGQVIEYPMPNDTNVRRVFVDNSTNPVTFWTGSNHGAAVVKVEPLD